MTLIHVIPSGEWGGPERYAFDICRHFAAEGWQVKALTREALAVDRHFRGAGIQVCHAPLRSYPDYYSARKLAALFRGMPKGEGVVHVHRLNDALTCILARKMARRKDIRLILTLHEATRARNTLLRRIVYRGIDRLLFVSEYSKKTFLSRWRPSAGPLPEEKTGVSYNSLLGATPEQQEPPRGPLSAAYRGKLKPGKGIETLIEAFGRLKDLRLRLQIIGKGKPDYVDSLRRRAHASGITDRIDWIRNTEFAEDACRRVAFGVLPSEQPEAFGMANIEFMASGRPQIATFAGAVPEVLEPEVDSLKIEPGDADGLAHAIRRLATDEALRAELGRNAAERYNTLFAWPLFIRRIERWYRGENID
ncbi:MAG: glycosyltransferase family 4 protein [Muribaculaceae bacterium]|nr:glycosyltransferase family 4 protein [Muribaculaceae bacterium]